MSEQNRRERQLVRYGLCLNDECEKCKTKEIQQVSARKDFVCEQCGKPLREVQRPHSWWNENGKKIIVLVVAVVISAVVWFFVADDSSTSVPMSVTESAVVSQVSDSTDVNVSVDTVALAEQVPLQPKNVTESTQDASSASLQLNAGNGVKLKCGKYEGPMSGGKPDGIGGTIMVTSAYTIDLKNGNGGKVTLEAGDRISNTKFKNGVLQQGQLIRSNGERKFMSGLSERL